MRALRQPSQRRQTTWPLLANHMRSSVSPASHSAMADTAACSPHGEPLHSDIASDKDSTGAVTSADQQVTGRRGSPRHVIPWPPRPFSYLMIVAYDGTDFDGYQMQSGPDTQQADAAGGEGALCDAESAGALRRRRQMAGKRTVQMELHAALSTRLNMPWQDLRLWVRRALHAQAWRGHVTMRTLRSASAAAAPQF